MLRRREVESTLPLMQRWLRQPQKLGLRKAIFQVHLWCGLTFGLYIVFISVTGSVLVYRNELYVAAIHEPPVLQSTAPLLDDRELAEAARRQHSGYEVTQIIRPPDAARAAEVWLDRDGNVRKRYFDTREGTDLGSASDTGMWLVSKLIELHSDLLAGPTGRAVNGIGALALLMSAMTGLVIWWPGIKRWRRSLTLRRGPGWRRLTWDLHSAVGIWSVAFILVFSVSGLYLSTPETFHAWADRLDPLEEGQDIRFIDTALSWLAFSHFGRINGIGLPCSGPGLCDQATKAVWALFGLAPCAMFVTGSIMWWNRVLRRKREHRVSSGTPFRNQ